MNGDTTLKKEEKKGFLAEILEIFKIIIVAAAIVLPIRYFIAQPFIVRGASMEPTYNDSDYLLIDEATYYFREPQRGEVIVFRYPQNPRQFFIKRIIALPGETVEFKEGKVKVKKDGDKEGIILDESYLTKDIETVGNTSLTLGEDEYFVLGDNRPASSDSRFWGPLSKKYLIGKALFRAWPLTKFGIVTGL